MLLQILKGTPTWVFGLFFALLAIGFMQTRSRTVSAGRLSLLPGAFIAFSLYGVIAAFGAQPIDLLAWAAGIGTAVMLGRLLKQPSRARWDASERLFHVPGSWIAARAHDDRVLRKVRHRCKHGDAPRPRAGGRVRRRREPGLWTAERRFPRTRPQSSRPAAGVRRAFRTIGLTHKGISPKDKPTRPCPRPLPPA